MKDVYLYFHTKKEAKKSMLNIAMANYNDYVDMQDIQPHYYEMVKKKIYEGMLSQILDETQLYLVLELIFIE